MDANTRQAADAITNALDDGWDVGEFIAHALCHVAADEEDGIDGVLRNRPGSWEAGHVQRLMAGTVGEDGEGLDHFRKAAEPEPGMCEAELRLREGTWRLVVCVPGQLPTSGWPTTELTGHSTNVPTVAARIAALASLGYRPADPDRVGWAWLEAQEDPGQPAQFIAHTTVRPL
jgi:hypothetical protein